MSHLHGNEKSTKNNVVNMPDGEVTLFFFFVMKAPPHAHRDQYAVSINNAEYTDFHMDNQPSSFTITVTLNCKATKSQEDIDWES